MPRSDSPLARPRGSLLARPTTGKAPTESAQAPAAAAAGAPPGRSRNEIEAPADVAARRMPPLRRAPRSVPSPESTTAPHASSIRSVDRGACCFSPPEPSAHTERPRSWARRRCRPMARHSGPTRRPPGHPAPARDRQVLRSDRVGSRPPRTGWRRAVRAGGDCRSCTPPQRGRHRTRGSSARTRAPVGDQHLPGVGQQFRHDVEHSMAPSSVRHCCILGSWVGSAYMGGQS
jgi:hypothetical protein